MKMTSTDLARLCNVSRATVDRVLNNRGYVSDATRKKVLDAAAATGYSPDPVARSLVTGSTRSIGLVLPGMGNAFFSTLLNAVTRKAQERDYITLFSMYEDRPEFEARCAMSLADRRVDGMILFSTEKSGESARMLQRRQIPAVAILNEVGGLPCVSIDYRRAMFDATSYAISMGYGRLVFLCPPLAYEVQSNIYAIGQRLLGFQQAVELRGGETVDSVVIGIPDYAERLLAMALPGERKTAVLCSSDIYALQALKLLKSRGIRVPYDVGVMGFDGIDMLDYVEPSLATVAVPIAGLGEAAAEILLDSIESGIAARSSMLPYSIRAGQSIV